MTEYPNAASAVVREREPGLWTVALTDSVGDTIEEWALPHPFANFYDDGLNMIGPHLNRVGLAYTGSSAWTETDGIWSTVVYELDERFS